MPRKMLVCLLATIMGLGSLPVECVLAQGASQGQGRTPAGQDQQGTNLAAPDKPQGQPAAPEPAAPARILTLQTDYSMAKPWFPHILAPYQPIQAEEPALTNSPRIPQLLHDGKLTLSLQDAISLALENNLAIEVQRFTPWLDEIALLRARSGVNGLVPFDPTLTGNGNLQDSVTPVNNPLFAGFVPTGTTVPVASAPPAYVQHIGEVNLQYSQYFASGTQFQAALTNTRSSTNFGFFNLYNPAVQSALTLTITQPLLRGFGVVPNTRLIIEAKRNLQIGLSQLEQQVMTTTTQVSSDYWELVYAREAVKVQQTAVDVSQRLFEENSKRLQIGTLSSLDVLTAQSQLASDKQALVQAQSVQLQDQTTLLNDITRNPLDPALLDAEIVTTTPISTPPEENIHLGDAVQEAWQKRPELKQAALNLQNAGTEVQAAKNELLPAVNIFGQYIASGLGGVQTAFATTPTGAFIPGLPVVDATGAPVPGLFQSTAETTVAPVVFPGGAAQDFSRLFRGNYSSFEGGISFTLPIRNRAAQADSAQALLNQRQQKVQYRQEQNAIFVSVRNALIAIQEDRASVTAAEEARKLAVQTFQDEQEKYRLGASTAYDVVLRSRDVVAAEATELRDRANLLEDELRFNQAMGRTLEVNNISIADALKH